MKDRATSHKNKRSCASHSAKHNPFYKKSVFKFFTYYSSIRTDVSFQIAFSSFHLNNISEA